MALKLKIYLYLVIYLQLLLNTVSNLTFRNFSYTLVQQFCNHATIATNTFHSNGCEAL